MFHLANAIFLAVLAYLTKYRRVSWLIAGYNTSSPEAKDKIDVVALCHGVGNLIFVLSACMLLGAVGEFLKISLLVNLSWALFILAVMIGLIYINTGNRYKKG